MPRTSHLEVKSILTFLLEINNDDNSSNILWHFLTMTHGRKEIFLSVLKIAVIILLSLGSSVIPYESVMAPNPCC